MFSRRRIVFILFLTSLLFIPSRVSRAQEAPADNQQIASDEEMLGKAEKTVRLIVSKTLIDRGEMTIKTERQLKTILQLYPDTSLRERVEENLFQVQESLALHNLQIAQFYFNRGGVMKGAESRLLHIVQDYPRFSRMDEVFLLLGKVYLKAEQPEDAANYFWKLVCKYPGSRYVNDAFEQLSRIGLDASKGCNDLKP